MTALAVDERQVKRRVGSGVALRVLGRLGSAVLVLFAAASATFFAQALLPGDRATLLLNQRTGQTEARSDEELAPIRAEYGFDDPILLQYADYLGGLLSGRLGVSYQMHQPVEALIAEQIPSTLLLTVTALAVAWVLTVIWTVATTRRSARIDAIGSGVETVAAGLPPYWLGVILLVVFALGLGWFPVIGGSEAARLVLPALTLGIPLAGFMGQATRAAFERALDEPFVTSARMRGMSDLGVRVWHVLRHAALPGITLSGWALGSLISGAVIVETIFARPGIGRVLVSAVNSRDLPVVGGVVIVVALVYVVVNLVVDLAYSAVDPRLATE
ncbi:MULTISPECIES: ABC transporter permease [unclassified Salinibacterium]|uniref:ABC transporter permease n=1 Tax=unclassified Salinibacterium TaxID=2632331 RepID=UPI001F108EDA|nr:MULTISPECIES: ABC transporter permease [unclassified Salinibacterium]